MRFVPLEKYKESQTLKWPSHKYLLSLTTHNAIISNFIPLNTIRYNTIKIYGIHVLYKKRSCEEEQQEHKNVKLMKCFVFLRFIVSATIKYKITIIITIMCYTICMYTKPPSTLFCLIYFLYHLYAATSKRTKTQTLRARAEKC